MAKFAQKSCFFAKISPKNQFFFTRNSKINYFALGKQSQADAEEGFELAMKKEKDWVEEKYGEILFEIAKFVSKSSNIIQIII